MKDSPYISDKVEHGFYFESSKPVIKYGGLWHKITNPNQKQASVLRIRGKDIITIYFEDNILTFDIAFYNAKGDQIAGVEKGDWWADTEKLWDMEYKKKALTLASRSHGLGLEIEYDTDEDLVNILGKFFYKNRLVELYTDRTVVNQSTILSNHATAGAGGVSVK
ncbi:hypothetical protein [Haloferax sp. Atlit-6N]|uniref:hypothetical protein n=1 Tax=Haloferax sp. Atlit-6N TaxID=2077205 RepID=UPI001F46C06B|nr:hypothetical protein [Haloferax sp. Atlit-6N]